VNHGSQCKLYQVNLVAAVASMNRVTWATPHTMIASYTVFPSSMFCLVCCIIYTNKTTVVSELLVSFISFEMTISSMTKVRMYNAEAR
jgi:hypothetical protein